MNAMSMRRREFLQMAATTVGATALGGALAACGGSSQSTSGSTVTIEYWDWLQGQAPWVDNEIKLFQQAHPKIRVAKTTQVFANYANLLSLSVKGNKMPDIALMPYVPGFTQQVTSGWWNPLDKWATTSWQSQFPTGSFNTSNMLNGKIYSAPLTAKGSAYQLYINNSVFKQAGLTNADGSVKIPQTWDDVTHAAETITQKSGGSTFGLGFGNSSTELLPAWMQLFTAGAGSPCWDKMPDYRVGKWNFSTDRNYLDFLKLLLEWKQKGYIYPTAISASDETARAAFAQGKIGMTVGGVWNQAIWTASGFTDYTLVGLVPPTQTIKGYYYYVPGGKWIGMSATSKHPDEAWAWFDWYYSPAAGKRWVQMGEDLSVYAQNNDPSLAKFAPFAQYVATAKLALPGPNPLVRNPDVAKVVVPTNSQDLNSVMVGAYTGQITDIQGALSALDDRYNKALAAGIALAVQKGAKVSINDYIFSDWDITKPYVTKPGS
jgi:ABC-type sugar transport system, periplasmic component